VSVRAVAAVPAAPLLLAAISPQQPSAIADEVARLRRGVGEVLRGLPDVDVIALVAGGDDATLPDGGCVDLAGYGHPQVRGDLPVDRELLAAVATRTSTPRVRADVLTGDLAVLALLVAEARPDATVLPMTVAATAAAASLGGYAAGFAAAVDALGRDVALVAAGDLSAARETTSPGYLVEGAVDWDRAALAALEAGDVEAFATLGPAEARRVAARGWAPLTVLLQVARAAGVELDRCELSAPRGVGQLVATSAP
jgi:aromatic ring-opening dioxygenase LigB subunit